MELKEGKKLFDEILELCYFTENPRLIEIADSIYNEIDNAEDINQIISSCAELQIVINEIDILPEEETSVIDIQTKIESLSE